MVVLAATTSALPTSTRLTDRQLRYHEISRRQNDAAAALGLNDFDILQLYVYLTTPHSYPGASQLTNLAPSLSRI